MAVNTFKNKRQKPRTTKKKRGDNRSKISAAGEQMDMLIDLAGPGKGGPKSAMEKAKGVTGITEPPKGSGIDWLRYCSRKECKCGANDKRVSGVFI